MKALDERSKCDARTSDLMAGRPPAIKTRPSDDGGIDFLGWLRIPETLAHDGSEMGFRGVFRMLVLGQAKRYRIDRPVGVSHVRELVGTAAAFHHDQLARLPRRDQQPAIRAEGNRLRPHPRQAHLETCRRDYLVHRRDGAIGRHAPDVLG